MFSFRQLPKQRIRRRSAAFAAVILCGLLAVLPGCGSPSASSETEAAPKFSAQVGDQKLSYEVSGVATDETDALFAPDLKQHQKEIVKTGPGVKAQIKFSGAAPDAISVTETKLLSDGSPVAGQKKDLQAAGSQGSYSFVVDEGFLSAEAGLRGFCITASWGDKQYRFPLLIQVDPNFSVSSNASSAPEPTQRIQVADYELFVPTSWGVEPHPDQASVSFTVGGKAAGSITRLHYDPTKPIAQFFAEGTPVTTKNLENMSYPTTEVTVQSQTSSSGAASTSSGESSAASGGSSAPVSSTITALDGARHIFVLYENTHYAYDLNLDPELVSEEDAVKIAGTINLIGQEVIESVNEKLKENHPDIDITNEFVSEDFGTAVLFGSLKSDPTQGVAVEIDFPIDSENKTMGKTVTTPTKHGAIRAEEGVSAKSSVVSVVAEDGHEWLFNIYNGFSEVQPSSEASSSEISVSSVASSEVSSAASSK